MRKDIFIMLFLTMLLLVACGGNNEENNSEGNRNTSVDNINNEMNVGENNVDNNMNDNESNSDDFALVDTSLDISESITDAYDFFDKLYFSNAEIIDEEIGLLSADVTVYLDNQDSTNMATLKAHTIEPKNSITLSIYNNPDDFEDKLSDTDADGNKMAVEVTDGAYEYAEKLIWKNDDLIYQLDGGRSVISINKENEIHPEEDRLLFYEHLVPTNNELKTYDAFYQNIKMPTQLPEGFTLYRVTLFYDQPQGFSKAPAAQILYEMKGSNNETITFIVYGEYEKAPTLRGDDGREETILQTTVQINEESLLFTLDDTTYEIGFMDIPEETILGIAESIIEQAE